MILQPQTTLSVSKFHLWVMVALVLFSPLAIDLYLPALPVMAGDFSVPLTQVQLSISVFMAAMGVGQIMAGPLADKYGRRFTALSGVAIYFVAAVFAWAANEMNMLLLARVLQGLGACATSVAAFATVRDVYGPKRSGYVISYLNGAICFVPALAPLLGAFLTQSFGWRSNFSFMAGFAALVWMTAWVWFEETKPTQEKAPQHYFKWARYAAVLGNKTFIYHAILCMLAMSIILAYVTSAPATLMVSMGLTMNEFTYWFGVNAGLNIIAAFSAPKFMQRFGTLKVLLLGQICIVASGIVMLLIQHFQTPWSFMLPIMGSSLGFAWILGGAAGQALAPFGDKAGTAAALLGLFQMTGAGVVVALVQWIPISAPQQVACIMLAVLPMLIIGVRAPRSH